MTRPSTPPILSELRSASSPASQVAALRALKNEIIGHEPKKEAWIGLGVLAPIARILNTHRGNGKRKHRDVQSSRAQSKQRGARNDEEDARLQAIIIVGSLAHGGPAYVPPIYAGLVISPLLSLLSPRESSPQLVLATLKSLNAVADSLLLCHPTHDEANEGLLSLLYTERHLTTITQLLLQTSRSLTVQQQIALTATLINKTCREEQQRAMLAQAGVLEALAFQLAAFVVATGCAPSPSMHLGLDSSQIPTATPNYKISPILQAVSAIIELSKLRATQFLSSPPFAAVFQKSDPDTDAFKSKGGVWGFNASNQYATPQPLSNVIDDLLPSLPSSHPRSSLPASNFPPLGVLGSLGRQPQTSGSFSSAIEIVQTQGLVFTEEEESPLIGWLLYIARTENEVTGLAAAWVLAILYSQGLTKRGKEAAFALLLVPALSRMLDKDFKISSEIAYSYDTGISPSPERLIKERAPLVLAMLAAGSFEVQRAAADAGVIKKLSQLLKESYDELPLTSSASMWSPDSSTSQEFESRDDASRLGPQGLSPVACHVVRLRESVLGALAAIASDKDEYRKAIIENGVLPFVIKTLKPEDTDPSPKPRNWTQKATPPFTASRMLLGNPKDAILAACGAARALSRSVCTLRTSLMDAGLTAPLFVLLKHQDIDLQIEATAVVCNLVLGFSPMQEAIIEAGVLKILCEHAHSINTNLRLNSVWALKHLVYEASNEVKMSCLAELGPGWLKQIVTNDVEVPNPLVSARGDRDEGSATPIRMSTPNAAGEQVDLLNAVDENSRASSQDVEEDGEEDMRMADSIGALSKPSLDGKRNAAPSSQSHGRDARFETAGLIRRNVDQRLSYQGMSDELAIQKEGLDLLRNLLCGTGASDMIDFVFRELGQDKLFEMLASKLRPRVFNAFNRERRSSENGVRHVQPQNEIVLSICNIVVNIAAGDPRQRQLLIAQTELLKLIIPLFNHTDFKIRSCCAWICINLTWPDNASDELNCKARARELAKLGVYEKLEQMENDPELDVRERSKTASYQMSTLLRH